MQLRKQNHSVYEISQTLKDRHCPLSPPPCGRSLKPKGLLRCLGAWTKNGPINPVPPLSRWPISEFSLAPRKFTTRCGGLFLFLADLVRLQTIS